ncbi:MAG: radical SAM family heme chaperone HemW [Deltaproteobacteria bacterium]|nr:radical SAM family heme chaperone HemW [Deltaproteobacteria bacterium]TLN01336.1 MAG: radical SAM family heme chaperone HemW [bacterium]
MSLSLYIHYPFCLRKCRYCAFNSVSDAPCSPDEYLTGLLKELELSRELPEKGSAAGTLYFGGGTPSLLEPAQVARIIEAAAKQYALAADAEITLECNPGTITRGKLAAFRAVGVNRLSLGVQSFDDELLDVLGRSHSAEEALGAFRAAREAGYDNIGLDLIYSLPGQSLAQWQRELSQACELKPEHLSVYGLTIEEGTPFALLEEKGELLLPDEEESARMYELSAELLAVNGYEQYEIANFARPGFRSRHNSGYWLRRPFLGCGAGAHSFLRQPEAGLRFSNTAKVADYLTLVGRGSLPTCESRNLSREEAMAECLFLGLRLTEGVSLERFREEFSLSFQEAYGVACADLFAGGLLEIRDGFVRLTGKARILSNQVFVRFL